MTENVIKCVVCKEDADECNCVRDRIMGGLVCPECKDRLMRAHELLVKWGLPRPIRPSDINQFNFKRFQSGYKKPDL